MSEWSILHLDGSPLVDEVGREVTTHSLEYNGSWMGECFVIVSFKNPYPISFKIGDYLVYRGEIFEINYDPGKIKQSRRNEYGEAFVYENVKFNSKQDELARTEFLDIVLHDNQIHYTALTKFVFYISSLDDLLDRIQANLDEQWGSGAWKLYSRNRLRSGQRGCDLDVWNKVYGNGVADNTIDSTSITADNLNCWSALALVNSQFDVNFITRSRNVFIGTAGLPTSHIFEYGKGKGLYKIEQNADSEQVITTRLRAYGSTKNLPNHYYATLNLQVFANVRSVESKGHKGDDYNVAFELDLPFSMSYFYNYLHDLKEGKRKAYLVTISCGGFKVRASAFQSLRGERTSIFAAHNNTADYPSHQNSLADIENFANAVNQGARIIFLYGVNREKFPANNKDYATDNLPNNMAVDHLMLPGFPNKSLKQWWDEQSEEEKNRLYQGNKSHLFSENKYRPYIDSANVSEIGVRPNSVYFDTKDIQKGIEEIYPTIEKVEIGGVRIDEVKSAEAIKDNGVFKDGATIPNFHVYLKSAIDFDITDLIGNSTETPTIAMKDGKCGGRQFKITSTRKLDDSSWDLMCERVKDDSLNLYFPYNDYQISMGDHFVLIGIPLPDSYVEAASKRLLKYALAFLDKNDYTRYVYSPKIDEIYMQRQHDRAISDPTGTLVSLHDTIKEGDILQFEDADLHIDGKISIDQLSIKETEGAIPTYEVTLREDKSVGTIQKIQEKINSLESGNGGAATGSGGNGLTVPQMQRLIETHGEKHFLDKLSPDTAQELITFLKGIAFAAGMGIDGSGNATLLDMIARYIKADAVKSKDFHSGLVDGAGFGIYEDEHGKSVAEVDKLEVRQKATFAELEYKRLAFTTGDVGFTSASAHIYSVIPVGANGAPIVNSTTFFRSANKQVMISNALLSYRVSSGGNSISAYRCYFLAEDDDHAISNDWRVGDQAMCKTGNLISRTTGNAANRYYWRLVMATGEERVNGRRYYYVDLSNVKGKVNVVLPDREVAATGMDMSVQNDDPLADDSIIQLGSQTDPDRQYAYIIYTSEARQVIYAGISTFALEPFIIEEHSPRGSFVYTDSFTLKTRDGGDALGGINLVVEGLKQAGVTLRNGQITLSADKTRIQGSDGTPSAIFNADGTIDARHIIAQGTEDRIEYGIIDGRANLIIKDKQGNTMLLLNRNGIVLPTDITAYARRKAFTMTVKDASDGVYVSVLISLTLFVRNTGFERSTFGNNIRIEVDVPILGIKDLVVPVGVVESAGQGKTLNVDETGEILYVATWNKQYKVGTPVPLTPEFEYRVLWRNKVIDKGTGEITRMHEGS